eukprot:COSAG02_NODE_2161_length_9626_cov_89.931983_1_plen_22_part_10
MNAEEISNKTAQLFIWRCSQSR